MDHEKIREHLATAELYLRQVKEQEHEYNKGIKEVNQTADNAEQLVLRHFTSIQEGICSYLNERKNVLLDQIQKARGKGATPLTLMRNELKERIQFMEIFITLGRSIDANPVNLEAYNEFIRQSKELENCPVPKTNAKVSYISFEGDDDILNTFENYICEYGLITTTCPVQLNSLKEKPGAIYVEWRMVDSDEHSADVQEFCLQRASGDGVGLPNFQDCYVGTDTHFLCKDVIRDLYYSFRVRCKFEGQNQFSRWSIPLAYKTSVKPYSWKENGHYSMNDEFRIAGALIDAPPMLISEGPQYRVGYTLEFTILEMDDNIAHIGLMTENKKNLAKMEDPNGTFIVDSKGTIKVDGITKSTFLPEFKKNCKLFFTCECLKDTRVVIHIDLDEKRVTYEWAVNKDDAYFFAAQLPTKKWKIMVE